MQWNNEIQNLSRDQSQNEFDNRQSVPYRSSATDKMKASVLRNSTFKGLVNNISTSEIRNTKQSKQEGAAQGWDGQTLYEMNPNVPPREQIDTSFILFDQLPKDVRILTMACTDQHVFLVTTLGNVYSWGTQAESLGRKTMVKQDARTPTQIPELKEIVNIVTGDKHVLALDIHGYLYSWGSNQHGQLGLGQNVQVCDTPTPIKVLEDVVQIYAGPACSFAVTRGGALYCWGQNSYGQLGQAGPDVFMPKEMHPQSTPWTKENDIAIVTGKTHVGYVFTTLTSSKHKTLKAVVNTLEHRKQDLEIKQLREEKEKLSNKNKKLKEYLVGKAPSVKLERNFEEDPIIKQLKEDLKVTNEDITFIEQRTKHLKEEINGVKNDLAGIQQQLKDIEQRENTLSDDIQHLENEILQKRDRSNAKDLLRKKKTVEELARANEQIKNMIQQKLSDKTDKERELQHENNVLEKKKTKLKEREEMVLKLMAERKTTIAQGAFAENQSEITGLIHNLYNIFKQAKDTTVEETSKNLEIEKGLLDILNESNEQLIKHKKDADKLKVNPSDALFEITSKILEMFQDNLNARLKMNEYSALVYAQATEKQIEAAQLDTKKKVEDKKKVRDARIAQLKQKYNIDPTRNTQSLGPNNPQKLNLSNNNNSSMQRATFQGITPKNIINSNDESPNNI